MKLARYRRFEEPVTIDVAGDVVALVGPNEAGKSSALQAMLSFDSNEAFSQRERTRGTSGGTWVRAGYVLDDEDRAALRDIPGGQSVRWWTLKKQDDGSYEFSLRPAPERDLQPRHQHAAFLRDFAKSEQIERFGSINNQIMADLYEQAVAALSSDTEDLGEEEVDSIQAFAKNLLAFPSVCDEPTPESTSQHITSAFCAFLQELRSYDEGLDPHSEAADVLMERRPSFLMFEPEDRDLRTTYDLQDVMDDMPPALANLAQLARLDLRKILGAAMSSDRGLRETLLEQANGELQNVFATSWRQTSITVRLGLQGTLLEVLVSLPGGGFSEIEERSAGLLSFVALRAFLAKYDLPVPSILLVDESETHLHYDAQADLINLFTNQRLAAKVIYTTHSAGCLPRDLGNGIRVVVPFAESERSTVRNSVWQGREAGFTPIVFGMGATTFAFLPARSVLIGEGVTDAMLYPTLFREATGQRTLPFQVAPGLAVASRAQMLGLASEGGTVVFLTDGDADGRRYRRELEQAGVPEGHIFDLERVFGEPVELEDLVAPVLYAVAVNEVLRDFQHAKVEYRPKKVPSSGRARAVKRWCEGHGLKAPDKADIVQRLLDTKSGAARRGDELRLLAGPRRGRLACLCNDIEAALDPTAARRSRDYP